jgi:tRNA A37 threonylcarbamoyladenosine dehydratase
MDEVCVTNTNRQIHAHGGTVGSLKTSVMAERIRLIHPACRVGQVPKFFNAGTAQEILDAGFDAVIDAIDDTRNKCLLLAECHRRDCVTVTCGGAGGRTDPTRVKVTDLAFSGKDGLLHQVRKRLRQEHGFAQVPMGSRPTPIGIDAVFSDEPQVFSQCDGEISSERPDGEVGRLNCVGGLGAATHVTAVFGLVAVGRVLQRLAEIKASGISKRPRMD